ncbi:AraC family transcriptional regulator [Paenibacillus psychroresistens]|uniref:AraC family transcriptional regulator n=1 Tax=Paenibacillus psychroresistens TaxID=1778678 RepID=UPI001D0380F9|nr:helix-turn-helix domain-containing protein [Paenibacillus psychroresistens]
MRSLSSVPYYRFSSFVRTYPESGYGPRICYIPSLYRIESGKGRLITEKKTYEICEGVQLYIEAGIRHQWVLDSKNPIVFKVVFFEWCRNSVTELEAPLDYFCDPGNLYFPERLHPPGPFALDLYRVSGSSKPWTEHFDHLVTPFEVMNTGAKTESLRKQARFLQFIEECMEIFGVGGSPLDPRIRNLMNRLKADRYGKKREDAEKWWYSETGLSRSHLYALFKEHTDLTPQQYWLNCRMDEAKDELRSSLLSITEIAELLGYSSIHSFSKSFSRIVGKTPSRYRQEYRF